MKIAAPSKISFEDHMILFLSLKIEKHNVTIDEIWGRTNLDDPVPMNVKLYYVVKI